MNDRIRLARPLAWAGALALAAHGAAAQVVTEEWIAHYGGVAGAFGVERARPIRARFGRQHSTRARRTPASRATSRA